VGHCDLYPARLIHHLNLLIQAGEKISFENGDEGEVPHHKKKKKKGRGAKKGKVAKKVGFCYGRVGHFHSARASIFV
jgi:hypothetical protein